MTVAAARALGLEAIATPLFTVRAIDWTLPDDMPDALLMTSANAARLAGPLLDRWTSRPLYAVGEATAAAARDAGFTRIMAGDGGIDAILRRAAADGVSRLLHLAGREHKLPASDTPVIERRIVYAADAVSALPADATDHLPEAVVLLHSPRAAEHFATLVNPSAIRIAAISPAVASAAGPGWREVAVANHPTDASLLAAAAKLCNHGG